MSVLISIFTFFIGAIIFILGFTIVHEFAHYACLRIFDKKSHAIIAIMNILWFFNKPHIIRQGEKLDVIVVEGKKIVGSAACVEIEDNFQNMSNMGIVITFLAGPLVNAITFFTVLYIISIGLGIEYGNIYNLVITGFFLILEFLSEYFFIKQTEVKFTDWRGALHPKKFRDYMASAKRYDKLNDMLNELSYKKK